MQGCCIILHWLYQSVPNKLARWCIYSFKFFTLFPFCTLYNIETYKLHGPLGPHYCNSFVAVLFWALQKLADSIQHVP